MVSLSVGNVIFSAAVAAALTTIILHFVVPMLEGSVDDEVCNCGEKPWSLKQWLNFFLHKAAYAFFQLVTLGGIYSAARTTMQLSTTKYFRKQTSTRAYTSCDKYLLIAKDH